MEEDEWELDYVSEGEEHSFSILLRLCLVSSFHFWYSCQRELLRLRRRWDQVLLCRLQRGSMVSEYFRLSEGDS